MVEAQKRISDLFDICINFQGFVPERFTYDIRCFRPNENRDHIEFHFMGSALQTDTYEMDEYRTYFVHVYPNRSTIRCRINIVKMRDDIGAAAEPKRWTNVKKRSKKEQEQFLKETVERIENEYDVFDSSIESETVLGEHVLVEAKRRLIYFGWGDIP